MPKSKRPKFRFYRVFQWGLCTDGLVEIYRITPPPKHQGNFLLTFREKRRKIVLQLWSGMTLAGAKALIESFRSGRIDPTELLLYIFKKKEEDLRCPWSGLTFVIR